MGYCVSLSRIFEGVYAQVVAAHVGQRGEATAAVETQEATLAARIAALQAERAGVAAKGQQIETETAPIRYVAAVFGVNDQEAAIGWLIALMVLCRDPLAIALTAAGSSRR